jgi:sulfate permease, SulP family
MAEDSGTTNDVLALRRLSQFSWERLPFAPIRVPIIDWLPTYTRDDFTSDLVAGLTVFVLLIPQGMAYAVLAQMPVVYGLYTATVPCFIYALLGTSHQLSMGPMAITSLLLGSSAQSLGYKEDDPNYVVIILNISMLAGIILYILGTLRLGVLTNFLSQSVLAGFLTASALIIALSQLKYITGIHVPRMNYTHQTILYLLSHLNECNPFAMLIGLSSWLGLYKVRTWKKSNKITAEKMKSLVFRIQIVLVNLSSLIAIFMSTIVAYAIVTTGHQLQIVGYVPPGLKPPGFSFVDFATLSSLAPTAFIISMVSFAGNWAIAKKFAAIGNYEVEATQELIAEGLTNIIGVLFNAFMVSGGLARTAVNAESGARTQISGCISAVCIMISLLLLTRIFYYIPMAILGAIIEVSVASMIDFNEMVNAYYIDRQDFVVMLLTFMTTFFVGISEGVLIGVIVSILFVVNATAFPYIAHLGKLPDEDGGNFRDVRRFPSAHQLPQIAIVRLDASLYFANANHFKDTVNKASRGESHSDASSKNNIHLVILDVSAWIDIDLAGINTLVEIHSDLLTRKIQLAFANAKGHLRDRLKTAKFVEKLGEQYLHGSIVDAVRNLPWRRSTLQLEVLALESNYQHIPASLTPSNSGDQMLALDIDGDDLSPNETMNIMHQRWPVGSSSGAAAAGTRAHAGAHAHVGESSSVIVNPLQYGSLSAMDTEDLETANII